MPSLPAFRFLGASALLASILYNLQAQAPLKYQEPPKALAELVDTRPTPDVEVSPKDKTGRQWLLIEEISGLPPISDLAQPELRLAGLRFNPKTNGPSRGRYVTALRLKALPDGASASVLEGENCTIRRSLWLASRVKYPSLPIHPAFGHSASLITFRHLTIHLRT